MKRTASARRSSKSSDTSIRPHRQPLKSEVRFALCLTDSEPDLELWKVYRSLPDPAAAQDHYVRVIDESVEDYLYPDQYFTFLELSEEVKNALSISAHAP